MQITFSPKRHDGSLHLEKASGDRLRINGELFNFNPLGEGDTIPERTIPCEWIIGPVERIDGEICLTLILPLPADCIDPWMCFPEPISVTDDGSIDVPFATYTEVTEERVEGGTKIITTTHRWRQPDEVEERVVPDDLVVDPASEEPADVDA